MTTQPTYLDYNATAPLRPEARDAMTGALDLTGNPSSVHGPGRKMKSLIEDARDEVMKLVGGCAGRVVFTSGGTEANNLAIGGGTEALGITHIFYSAVEHDAVRMAAWAVGARFGIALQEVPVDGAGRIDLAQLKALLGALPSGSVPLLALMAANNETGAVQPLIDASQIIHDVGGYFHVDAVQAAGKMPIRLDDWQADFLALSAHKLGGPQGAGALVVGTGIDVAPMLVGGGQETRFRAGTENVAAIAGFGAAAKRVRETLSGEIDRLLSLRSRLEAALPAEAMLLPPDCERLVNTLALKMPGMKAETQIMNLDLEGFAVSAGSACSSGKVAHSHVLTAMGIDDLTAETVIRVSFGWATTEDDIDRFAAAWTRLADRSAQQAAE